MDGCLMHSMYLIYLIELFVFDLQISVPLGRLVLLFFVCFSSLSYETHASLEVLPNSSVHLFIFLMYTLVA